MRRKSEESTNDNIMMRIAGYLKKGENICFNANEIECFNEYINL
jgi:hypothetical protein